MPGTDIQSNQPFVDLAGMEARICDSLSTTADELAHAECFDQEQRAEIYSILQALRNDSDNHRAMVDLLASKIQRGDDHA